MSQSRRRQTYEPKSDHKRRLTLKIDGNECGARHDQSILEVARENGIEIPTLCYMEGLSEYGACRLCLVEIKGTPKLHAACITLVQPNMEITVNSPRLAAYRKLILELLFSERNHICSVCVTNGHCDLQSLAEKLGVTHITVPYQHPKMPVDASHRRFVSDHNRCILCTRCVRVCDEIEGAHAWDVFGRGEGSKVITDLNGHGEIRRPAQVAENACRCVRRERLAKKERARVRCRSVASSCHT